MRVFRIWRRCVAAVLFFCAAAGEVFAAPVMWRNDLTADLPEWGMLVSRPDSRWRALTPASGGLEFRYYRRGGDVTISLDEGAPIKGAKYYLKNRKAKADRSLLKTLLGPYEAAGFQFYKAERPENNVISARATNANREILFLHIYLLKGGREIRPLVLEMLIPRADYTAFSDSFEAVARSLRPGA